MEFVKTDLKIVRMKQAVNALVADLKTQNFPVDMILLFGSALGPGFNEYSDLDICVVCEKDLEERQLREIEMYFRDKVEGEMEIDFIYCNRQKLYNGDLIFESVRKEGLIIYENLLGSSSGGSGRG